MTTPFKHAKVNFRWCEACGTLILGPRCDHCGSSGRDFEVSAPGDIRPCMGRGTEVIRSLFMKYFGTTAFLEGKLLFLNKISGEDRADEIVVDGRVVGVLRFSLLKNEFLLELRLDGALLLWRVAKRGVVTIDPPPGHLKGKNISGRDIREMKGSFLIEDPLIVLAGNLVCTGAARVSSDKLDDSEKAIGIRDVGKGEITISKRRTDWGDFVRANVSYLAVLESSAVSDVKSFVGNNPIPVTLSFSGGKDSLACFGIARKALKAFDLIFVDTGLEFPETVQYVQDFARRNHLRLIKADAGKAFWEQVGSFGPPAKDFRWCCKVCKLAPLTSVIEANYLNGTITIEGNRIYESFARARIDFVEHNPFVPNQIILNPIRGWRAVDVWGYIWWKNLEYNQLYDEDFERIGCYLCPSCLASEWRTIERIHPDLSGKWNDFLDRWAKENDVGKEFIAHGFWRWKILPPKMRKLAEHLNLKVPQMRADRIALRLVKGVSPCATGGYSIEAVVSLPRKRDFARVAEMLKTVGKVRYSGEYEIALVKKGDSTAKVFGGGQIVATSPTPEKTEKLFESSVKAFLRSQLCAVCGICAKNCKQHAIKIGDNGPIIGEESCTHCGKCSDACVVAHYYDKIVT
ncbi:MAG: phosphoadenosine phosphosulfate reductase family protein [Methanomassiliicoccales archaeon]|nr:phosphoadenosine phosphosulfate reductase family protein [Methanomassiliicoccales archaeon]